MATDPNVFYDATGKLWMVFGKDWGGIYIIEMDPEDGGLTPYCSGNWSDDKHLYTKIATGEVALEDRENTDPERMAGIISSPFVF